MLWLDEGTDAPADWTGDVAWVDVRVQTYRRAGEAAESLNEHVWNGRRSLARDVTDAFYARLEGRREAEAMAPYRTGLRDAMAQRLAPDTFLRSVAEALGIGRTPIAVLKDSRLERFGLGWLTDRAGSATLSTDAAGVSGLTPFPPPPRVPRALGELPAEALLGIRDSIPLPESFEPEGGLVAISSLAHGTHVATISPVVRAMRETEPVLLINTAPRALPGAPDHAELEAVLRDPQRTRAIVSDTMRLWGNPASGVAMPDPDLSLRRLFMRVMHLDLPRLVALDKVLEAAGRLARPHLIGTTDSTFTSDFMRARAPHYGITRTVVQNAFVSGSARYTRPEAERVLTLDAWSSGVIHESFGVSRDTMEVVGSVRYAHLPALRGTRPEGEHSKAAWLAQQGFDPDARLFAFAAQPHAHSSGPVAFIRAMEEAFGAESGVAFAVRLHPKELDMVVAEVHAAVAASPLQLALDTRPIEPFLLSADVVLTEFSNVGLEAGIMGLPLLILKLPGSPAFPPLDEFGIGRTVESYAEAADALRTVVADGVEAAGFPDTSGEFASKNPGLYKGDTVDAILRSVAASRA